MMKGPLIGQGRTAEVFAWGDNQILKLYREGFPAYLAESEAKTGQAVYNAGVTAPAIEGLVEVEGRHGIIYERVKGLSMLEVFSRKPWLFLRLARQFAELHAQMHAIPQQGLPLQSEMFRRNIAQAALLSAQTKEKVLEKLAQIEGGNSTCHGDFHPDNIIMSERGPVIIDWMTASQGNALADVARTSYLLTSAAVPPGTNSLMKLVIQIFRQLFHSAYLRYYSRLRPFSAQQLKEWQGVIAAARLSEQITEEETRLLAIVEKSFA